jgi:hypothetical protein
LHTSVRPARLRSGAIELPLGVASALNCGFFPPSYPMSGRGKARRELSVAQTQDPRRPH